MANRQVNPVRRTLAVIGLLISLWIVWKGIAAIPHGNVAGGPVVWIALFGGVAVLFVVSILMVFGRR